MIVDDMKKVYVSPQYQLVRKWLVTDILKGSQDPEDEPRKLDVSYDSGGEEADEVPIWGD